jgi:isoquinoline 1-oxidoreductase beta subunit
MLYATYTKAPAIGGRVASANLEHVRGLPGVKHAFTIAQSGNPLLFDLSGAPAVLSGVAIVADSTWAAMQAKKALEVQWDETDASHDSWTAAVAEAKRLATQPPAQMLGEGGDVDAALAAGKTVEAFYGYHYVAHADLEPQNCTAWFKGDSVEIWAPTQTPQAAVDAMANLLELPKDKVLLHQLRGGGGFGRRLANDSVCEAVLISKQAGGVPVKVQWTREDDMAFDYYRAGGFMALKAGVDASGKLAAWQNHFITFSMDGKTPVSAGNIDRNEFPANVVANRRMAQSLIASKIPTGPWRAPGSNVIAFCIQSFLNECAVAAKRDYVDFLVDVMGEARPLPPDPFGGVFHTGRAVSVIKAVAEKSGWGRPMPAGRGLGLAFHFSHQGHFAEAAEVSVDANKKVTVHRVWVVADIGPIVNLSSAENQCQGSVVDAISTAMGLKITFENGRVEQANFHQYPIVRIDKAPEIEVHFLDTDYPPTGCGEPAFPPVAPAIANAIFAASGQRPRMLPFSAEGYSI